MDLVALAKNPVPSGAITGTFKSRDGLRLRFARWEPTRGPKRGTVCLFQGRSESIEKYFEVVADLRRRDRAPAAGASAAGEQHDANRSYPDSPHRDAHNNLQP